MTCEAWVGEAEAASTKTDGGNRDTDGSAPDLQAVILIKGLPGGRHVILQAGTWMFNGSVMLSLAASRLTPAPCSSQAGNFPRR